MVRVVQPAAEDKDAAEGYLARTIEGLRARGLATSSVLLAGEPGERISEFASRVPASLVVMSTRCRAGFGRWVLGGVVAEVLRESGRPVLLARSAR